MVRILSTNHSTISGRIGDQVHERYKGGIYVRKAATRIRDANDTKMVLNQYHFAVFTRICVGFMCTLIPHIAHIF